MLDAMMDAVRRSADVMHKAAMSKDLEIDPQGAQAMIKALDKLEAGLGDMNSAHGHDIQAQPALGDSNGANVMKPWMQQVATDGSNGFFPVVDQFKEQIGKFREAVKAAEHNYRATEATIRNAMNKTYS